MAVASWAVVSAVEALSVAAWPVVALLEVGAQAEVLREVAKAVGAAQVAAQLEVETQVAAEWEEARGVEVSLGAAGKAEA